VSLLATDDKEERVASTDFNLLVRKRLIKLVESDVFKWEREKGSNPRQPTWKVEAY
jgi:hypothetical protein